MDTLYFDGRCPRCRRWADYLVRNSSGRLHCVDLHAMADYTKLPPRLLMLKELHLQTGDGSWLTGWDANLRCVAYLPWGWVAKLLKLPVLSSIGERLYGWLSLHRYRELYGCKNCAETE